MGDSGGDLNHNIGFDWPVSTDWGGRRSGLALLPKIQNLATSICI